MSNTTAQNEDLIKRAYVNLTSLRKNIPGGYVQEATYYEMFNRSLDQLQQTGVDVSEWRLPRVAQGELDSSEFFARIDAILTYFTISTQKTTIGFRK